MKLCARLLIAFVATFAALAAVPRRSAFEHIPALEQRENRQQLKLDRAGFEHPMS